MNGLGTLLGSALGQAISKPYGNIAGAKLKFVFFKFGIWTLS